MQVNEDFLKQTKQYKTPFYIYNLKDLKANFNQIKNAFPKIDVYYAMKCNPNEQFISTVKDQGAGFEIASQLEAEQLLRQGVDPSRIMCLHPIKSPEFLAYLHAQKITILAVDSFEEIDKIAQYAPGSKIVPRVHVENKDSCWDLSGKYGVSFVEVPALLEYAKEKNLIPYGLTTHVGSQCNNESSWLEAIEIYKNIWDEMKNKGMSLKLLSLGGGLPVHYRKDVASIETIGKAVTDKIAELFSDYPDIEVTIEPGRALAATSGILVTSVFGLAQRHDVLWAYIETGTYNGLIESIETADRQFYPLAVEHTDREIKRYNIGGPSCVTLDTPFEGVELPELKVGDRLYVLNAGAYLATCGAAFNGFPVPKEYFYQSS